jgi:uncharacterized protein YyaL (SSP411 family)
MSDLTTRFRFRLLAATALLLSLCAHIAHAQPRIDKPLWASRGLDVYNRIESDLGKANSALHAESVNLSGTQSGGAGGFAYVWAVSTQFRVLNALVRHDPATYTPIQRAFSDEMFDRYWENQRPGGYRSGVVSSAELYYDDNAHIITAEADAYAFTGDPIYLTRARATYNFVLTGEDEVGGGGIWFKVNSFGAKETVSTLQAARAALMLYRATGEQHYFDDADRLYQWCADTVQLTDGTFWEKLYVAGENAGELGDSQLVNSAGMAISANVEFYKATRDPAYLTEAQRIATRCLTRYIQPSSGRINDAGYWAFEMVDAFVDLYEQDGDLRWSEAVRKGLNYLHAYKQDPNGHYASLWGQGDVQTEVLNSWKLIDQAAVARAYLKLSQISPALPGDYNADGGVDAADYVTWRDNVGKSVVHLPNAYGAGAIGAAQYDLWREQFGATLSDGSESLSIIPEAGSLTMLLIGGWFGCTIIRSRRSYC